jgi:hypothetical protein
MGSAHPVFEKGGAEFNLSLPGEDNTTGLAFACILLCEAAGLVKNCMERQCPRRYDMTRNGPRGCDDDNASVPAGVALCRAGVTPAQNDSGPRLRSDPRQGSLTRVA